MTKKDIKEIKDTISVIIGTPFRNVSRSGNVLVYEFGELIDFNSFKKDKNNKTVRDENGELIRTVVKRGRHTIFSICTMRLVMGRNIILSSDDVLFPSDENLARDDFDITTFEFRTGRTHLDESILEHFRGDFSGYIVKDVKVKKFGDFIILFENGFEMQFFIDKSRLSDNWRFRDFKYEDKKSLIIDGNGILRESHEWLDGWAQI